MRKLRVRVVQASVILKDWMFAEEGYGTDTASTLQHPPPRIENLEDAPLCIQKTSLDEVISFT